MATTDKNPNAEGNSGEVTLLLERVAQGDLEARSSLMAAVYPELKRIAEFRIRNERQDHTLQATALVNELFLEMARSKSLNWRNRKHFLAVASQAMRRFLIDYAKAHRAERRGGGLRKLELDSLDLRQEPYDGFVVGELLEALGAEEPRMAQVVDMHCFGGLTYDEIGEVLGIDARTAKRDWQVARAWLQGQLRKRFLEE